MYITCFTRYVIARETSHPFVYPEITGTLAPPMPVRSSEHWRTNPLTIVKPSTLKQRYR